MKILQTKIQYSEIKNFLMSRLKVSFKKDWGANAPIITCSFTPISSPVRDSRYGGTYFLCYVNASLKSPLIAFCTAEHQ